jgi:hypothetical protein
MSAHHDLVSSFIPLETSLRGKLRRQPRVNGGMQRLGFNTAEFDWISEVADYLTEKKFTDAPLPLETLHTRLSEENKKWIPDNPVNFEHECAHRPSFQHLYERFIRHLGHNVFKRDFLFERTPILRFNFVGDMPDRFRSPSGRVLCYHSDTLFGDPFEGINCWLPLTRCYGTNAMAWADLEKSIPILERFSSGVEFDLDTYNEQGRQRFFESLCADRAWEDEVVNQCSPLEGTYGELTVFDPRCVHGTMENDSPATRVSMDFRLLFVDDEEALHAHWSKRDKAIPVESSDNLSFRRGAFYDERSAFEL